MKPAHFIDPRASGRQRGDALLEALIGILLMAVIALSLTYALARVFNSHRYTSTQNIALTQMRNLLAAGGSIEALCGTSATLKVTLDSKAGSPTIIDIPAAVTCPAASAVAVGVSGNAAFNEVVTARTRVAISTPSNNNDAKSLFGGDGIVAVSQ